MALAIKKKKYCFRLILFTLVCLLLSKYLFTVVFIALRMPYCIEDPTEDKNDYTCLYNVDVYIIICNMPCIVEVS